MDAQDAQRLLRADAARLDEELAGTDYDALADQVFARLGIVAPGQPVIEPAGGEQDGQ